jgi:branched-chain amino acid transport system substrate-binding protein
MLVPPPWREAFGQAKPYKIGSLQPLTGAAALGGRMAALGTELAIARINKSGGVNGRPVEWVLEDYTSKPDVGVRKARKLAEEDQIDAHQGGYLSNVCLACMPVWAQFKIVNLIGVCLDTTITTTKCNRYTFRPIDYAPAQALAFTPFLLKKLGKSWFISYPDYAYGQTTKDAYVAEITKLGGTIAGTMGIPLGTSDMTPFLSKIRGDFDGLFSLQFATDAVTFVNQAYDLGLTKRYRFAGEGAIAEPSNLPGMGHKLEGFIGMGRYIPVFDPPLNTPHHRRFFDEAKALATAKGYKTPDGEGVAPDRFVQSNFEAMNALKVGILRSGFQGRKDSMKLIEALEGIKLSEGDDFPQGDKIIRKEDHQAFLREFIFEMRDGKHRLLEVVPWERTLVPPACTFS